MILLFLVLVPLAGAYAWQFTRIYSVAAPKDQAALPDRVPAPIRLQYYVLSCARTHGNEEYQTSNPPKQREYPAKGFCSMLAWSLPIIKTSDIFPIVELIIGARHGAEMTRLKFNPNAPHQSSFIGSAFLSQLRNVCNEIRCGRLPGAEKV
ncbi:hypothetical protein [Ruegeria atlantica]|uniref:hypothetical protein n=1 Tax=Ruegeria atlantica TaxID=81569 RepID=UPI00147E71C9|nr:hypothetical protein [Ruegeria atlantica]